MNKAENLLMGLHKIVADLAPYFDRPVTEESMPRWLALDSAQKAVAQYFAALPVPPAGTREAVACEVVALADRYADKWRGRDEMYWLARLMQEVGELGSSLVGDHEDTPEHELRQIGSIAINWLRLRAALPVPREGEAGTPKVRWQDDKNVHRARSRLARLEGLYKVGEASTDELNDAMDALCECVASLTASEGTSDGT